MLSTFRLYYFFKEIHKGDAKCIHSLLNMLKHIKRIYTIYYILYIMKKSAKKTFYSSHKKNFDN